jgi:hypothetical protein
VADDPNLYGYCGGNPVNNIDPTGHWAVNVNWNGFLKTAITKAIWSMLPSEVTDALNTVSAFQGLLKGIDNSKWAKFLRKYTSMNENDFKEYLKSEGINYEFNENNTSDYTFTNTEGQKAVTNPTGGKKALISDQKLEAFNLMQGNIKEFLANNPGLSLEQVRGVFDSAVMSADNSWGFGKNEFRFEGRGSNYKGLYNAEAVVMNEGMVLGVFTRASTVPDDSQNATVMSGVFDYQVTRHHTGRVQTEVGQDPPTYVDDQGVTRYYQYDSGKVDKDKKPIFKDIDDWRRGSYKALYLTGELPAMRGGFRGRNATGIMSHSGWETMRGSEGCMTMWADDYITYMGLFNSGDTGKFIIAR